MTRELGYALVNVLIIKHKAGRMIDRIDTDIEVYDMTAQWFMGGQSISDAKAWALVYDDDEDDYRLLERGMVQVVFYTENEELQEAMQSMCVEDILGSQMGTLTRLVNFWTAHDTDEATLVLGYRMETCVRGYDQPVEVSRPVVEYLAELNPLKLRRAVRSRWNYAFEAGFFSHRPIQTFVRYLIGGLP